MGINDHNNEITFSMNANKYLPQARAVQYTHTRYLWHKAENSSLLKWAKSEANGSQMAKKGNKSPSGKGHIFYHYEHQWNYKRML